jgi:hypothetical protein
MTPSVLVSARLQPPQVSCVNSDALHGRPLVAVYLNSSPQ